MIKDYNTIQKEHDRNLREAIMQEEMARPPMPSDINARLMKRMEQEKARKRDLRQSWPWMAAACVAALIAVVFILPKSTNEGASSEGNAVAVKTETNTEERKTEVAEEEKSIATRKEAVKNEDTQTAHQEKAAEETTHVTASEAHARHLITEAEQTNPGNPEESQPSAPHEDNLIAQATPPGNGDIPAETKPTGSDTAKANETQHHAAPRTLTERDLPITRKENMEYTEEELALMKRQANEAYLKWVELELKIAKFYMEQTANK